MAIQSLTQGKSNKLILVGNGFDLAHGLRTKYKHFVDWYIWKALKVYSDSGHYLDPLLTIQNKYGGMHPRINIVPGTIEDAFNIFNNNDYVAITITSAFFQKVLDEFKLGNWVDIEKYYFHLLKFFFLNNSREKNKLIQSLNLEFNHVIKELELYMREINSLIENISPLESETLGNNFNEIFKNQNALVINFNYTETVANKGYIDPDKIVHIHGRVADLAHYPVIFGYGDETDPVYQQIEDAGDNLYLEHIKSFGYFRTDSYSKLLSFIDSGEYIVSILGHSCGISDRILLSEIFENSNCKNIEIHYHQNPDGTNNFKEITQEISRHFRPSNKNLMRRRILPINLENIIPQNQRK